MIDQHCSISRLAIFALCLAVFAANAAEPDPSLAISEGLFPITRGWVAIAATPVLKKERLAAIRGQLLSSYQAASKNSANGINEPDDCFIKRALDQGGSSFHVLDVNGDGRDDIIYSGDLFCVDGGKTAVWFATGGKYALSDGSAWDVRALKIQPGKSPSISSVAIGCCADPIDQYYLGEFSRIREQSLIVTKDTIHAEASLTSPKPFKSLREIALRKTPVVANAYDEGLSQVMQHAIFGNILSRFLKGASGSVVAERKDASGLQWAYVRIESDSDALRKDAPYRANVGWVEMKDLSLGK